MDFYDEDIDEDLLVDIPCEFCHDPFPMYLLIEHQSACSLYFEQPTSPTTEKNEIEDIHSNEHQKEELDSAINLNLKDLTLEPKKQTVPLEQTSFSAKKPDEKNNKKIKEVDDYQVIEDNLLQESAATFSFGSAPNKGKRVQEEKPSFKIAPIPILSNSESRYPIQNDLPESDNEENESLEEFWRRADIKIAQHLKALEKKHGNLAIEKIHASQKA